MLCRARRAGTGLPERAERYRMRAAIAVTIVAFFLLSGCSERSSDAASASHQVSFARWLSDSSPLDSYSIHANDSNNWYFPVRLDSFDLTQPLWTRRVGGTRVLRAVTGGGTIFVASAEGPVVALRADDGSLLWRNDYPGGRSYVIPHLTPYFLAVVRGKANASAHGEVRLLDPRDGGELMKLTTVWAVTDLFHDATRFYVLSYPSNLLALDMTSGRMVARKDLTRLAAEAVRAGDTLFLLGGDQTLSAISTDGLNLRQLYLGENQLKRMVAGDDWLCVLEGDTSLPGSRSLLMLNLPDLSIRWRHTFPDYMRSEPAVADDRVVGSTYYGMTYALGLRDGSLLWERDMEAPSRLIAVFYDRALVVSRFSSGADLERGFHPSLHRFYKRVPSWLPEGASTALAYSLLDVKTGKLLRQEVISKNLDLLAVVKDAIVFQGQDFTQLMAFPAKFTFPEGSTL